MSVEYQSESTSQRERMESVKRLVSVVVSRDGSSAIRLLDFIGKRAYT